MYTHTLCVSSKNGSISDFSSHFSSLCSYSPYELLSLYLTPLSASHNPLHTSPESTWASRKGHIHTQRDTKDTHINSSWAPPAYSGIRAASFSLSCGNSLITDGWELIQADMSGFFQQNKKKKSSCSVCKVDHYAASLTTKECEKAMRLQTRALPCNSHDSRPNIVFSLSWLNVSPST